MLTNEYLIAQMKRLLPIYDDIFDGQLEITVSGAVAKLAQEGVQNIYDEGSPDGYNYTLCVMYQVAKDMDFDVDYERLEAQYITRVCTLRNAQQSQG